MLEQIELELKEINTNKTKVGTLLAEAFKQRDEMIKMQGKVEETIIKLQEEERKILKKEEKLLATKEILGGYEVQGVIDVEEAIE